MTTKPQRTLPQQITRTLHHVDYRVLILGSIGIGLSFLWETFILHPEIIHATIQQHVGFTLMMTGSVFGMLIGMLVVLTTMRYYEPRILEYVHLPKEIEMLKDTMISLGSYVATIDDQINTKKLGAVFLFIHREIKSIRETLEKINKKVDDGNRDRNENERFYINQNLGLKLENFILRNKVKNLEERIEALEKKESEKEQIISKKTHTQNNDENTKIDDQKKKFESRD